MPVKRQLSTAFAVIAVFVAIIFGLTVFILYSLGTVTTWAVVTLMAASTIAILLIIYIAVALRLSLVEPASRLAAAIEALAEGNLSWMPPHDAAHELGQFLDGLAEVAANMKVLQDANSRLTASSSAAISALEAEIGEITAAMAKFAEGDFTVESQYRQRRSQNKSADILAGKLRDICADVQNVAASIATGNFKNAIDASKYNGEWQKLALGMNRAAESVALPLTQVKAACEGLAQGKLGVKVTADAKGELLQLKTAANNATSNLAKYVANIAHALENAGPRARTLSDFPNDFGSVKLAITKINERLGGGKTGPDTGIRTQSLSAGADGTPAAKKQAAGADIKSKFSGAAKFKGDVVKSDVKADFNRSDFGKY